MPSSRASSTPLDRHHQVVVEAGLQAASARLCERAANSSCRSREIENLSASCSLDSPSETVHSAGIRSLTSRQPSVVETAVTLPAGKARDGLGSTHGARVIDSTPPVSTTSASPDSMVREPMIAASSEEPQSRLTVVAGTLDREPGEQHRHPAHVAVVLTGLVGAAPHGVADRGRVQPRRLREHPGDRGSSEVVGSHLGERTPEPSERGPGGGVEIGGVRHASPSSASTCWAIRNAVLACRHPAVDGGLQQHFLDLVDGEPVAQRGAHVHRQLLVVAPGDQRGQGHHRAAAAVQARSGPDPAPRVVGDEVLEVAGEVGGARGGPVDVGVAEHLTAYGEPGLDVLAVAGFARQVLAEQRRRPRREPRRARGGRHRPARRTARAGHRRRSRGACRAGSTTSSAAGDGDDGRADLVEPVPDVEVGERRAHLHVALVLGRGQRVQQRRARGRARVRGSRGRTSARPSR